jgi:hypothetical protein
MEKIKNLAHQNKSKLLYIFLVCSILAGINTFLGRADYNLFIYLYMSYIWKFMENVQESSQEKINTFKVLIYSLFIDIFWCIYWNGKWNNLKIDPEGAIHGLVILTSWIGVLFKIGLIIMIAILEWSNIKSILPRKLQEKLNPQFTHQLDEN